MARTCQDPKSKKSRSILGLILRRHKWWLICGQKTKTPLKGRDYGVSGGEEGIRTLVPSFPDHPISNRRRYDRFGTSPQGANSITGDYPRTMAE